MIATPPADDAAPQCNDEETTAKQSSRARRQVSFGSIVIRDYSVTLGDHPCCSYGNPVQLDWSYQERGTFAVQDYEAARGRRRRSMREMVLSSYDRRDMLKDKGFSIKEMQVALRSVNIAKRQRVASLVVPKPASQLTGVLQGASSRMKKILFKKRRREQL